MTLLPRTPARLAMGAIVLVFGLASSVARGAEGVGADLERQFTATVRPFVETYCVSCHGREKAKAQLDLSPFSTMAAVVQDHRHWALVLEKLKDGEMPPEEAKKQPAAKQRGEVIAWIQAMRRHEAEKNAGDPGPVLARRLSNAEFDYTIRDLTGVDMRPAREFPVDPANQAGFDNSGESLAMSPGLMKKYLQAAKRITDHLVLKPDGFDFAPHPMLAETDRDKYSILRMVERGVRFVQLYHGSGSKWDAHAKIEANHTKLCREMDKPVAGLLADLKQRGLLESTLVVWAGEFGRTPVMQGANGRDHSPYGFSVWLAGGGVRGGQAIGATDELGFRAVENKVHVHDLHATMLAALGLDHENLTYHFEGRARRLTDVFGHVVREVLA